MLNNINCKEKIGIEINETARNNAKKLGVVTVEKTRAIKNNFADVIISNNALEHTTLPLNELKDLFCILKQGGKIIFIVPCESIKYKYEHNDINYHLYSWSPIALGNLFTEAGFKVIESKSYIHKWHLITYEMTLSYFTKINNYKVTGLDITMIGENYQDYGDVKNLIENFFQKTIKKFL